MKRTLIFQNVNETHAFARTLAAHVTPGFVLSLNGDLGAGKTTFVKAFFAALGLKDTVNSPTFTLYKLYDHQPPLIHVDAYRIEDESMAYEMDEVFDDASITVIEWASNVPSYLPKDHLELTLTWLSEVKRHVEVVAHGNTKALLFKLMD